MKTPPPPTDGRRLFGYEPSSLALLVASFAVFLLFRPYQGIIHDARLYVGYAMAALDPSGIGRDIVFLNDGQSKFSVYPVLMRELAAWIGPSHAAIVLTYSGLLLWFAAFALLVRRLLVDRVSDLKVIAVITLAVSLPAFYGGQGVFRFAEFYATPRVFAEACVMLALAALLTGRIWWAMLVFGVGLSCHPIMAAPGIGVALWLMADAPKTRKVLVGVAICSAVLLISATMLLRASEKPFAQFDEEWMISLNTKHALVFLRTWRFGDVSRILLHVVTVLLTLPQLCYRSQQLVRGVLLVVLAGILLSFLGADVASNVLVTQIQAWRALWLLSLVATILLGVLLLSVWGTDGKDVAAASVHEFRKAASLLLLVGWQMVDLNSTAPIFTLLASLLWFVSSRWPALAFPRRGLKLVVGTVCVLISSTVVLETWVTVTTAWSSPDQSMRWAWANAVATGIPGLFAIFGAALLAKLDGVRPERVESLSKYRIAFVLLAFAVFCTDSRSRYQKFIEKSLDARLGPSVSDPPMSVKGSVLWPYADLEPWALAGSSGWGTIVQGMPSVFDRQLAIVWAARERTLAAAGLLATAQTGAETIGDVKRSLDSTAVGRLCEGADAPSLVVLPAEMLRGVGAAEIVELSVPKLLYPSIFGAPWGRVERYALVRCRAMRPTARSSIERISAHDVQRIVTSGQHSPIVPPSES
ncbi:hypothetical protein [Gemmatimonas groenlandica]|uniref:Transmembrane protein n=1 Tax=Gemmatimonas groenlandica TaxID=2732249 RepID=A0A6M4IW60_9BACT|nr:hypothetical protein [Gemmatimonas groenlandica]QJR37766.1 hypothetical protein HKW67_20700 [Gemmatimonas groenlandica]